MAFGLNPDRPSGYFYHLHDLPLTDPLLPAVGVSWFINHPLNLVFSVTSEKYVNQKYLLQLAYMCFWEAICLRL